MGYCSCSLRSAPKYMVITRHLIKNEKHVAIAYSRRLKHSNGEELHIILGYLLLTKLCEAFCQEMGLTWLCVSISRMSCDNSNNVVAMSRIFEMLRRRSGAALHNLSCHTKIV